jgi:hypothetical protein
MENMDVIYQENFNRISQYNIQKGQIWKHKYSKTECKIISIHPLYGWVVSIPSMIQQDSGNISDFELVKQ